MVAFLILNLFYILSCKEAKDEKSEDVTNRASSFEAEKAAIIETLNSETKAAFQRDYESWADRWVHEPTITKTYINYADSSFSESVGWNEISDFVKTFIKEHPKPEPVPILVNDINVRLYEF